MMKENVYKKWMMTLGILFVTFLVLTFANFWYVSRNDNNDKQYISYAAELRVLIERFARSAGEAVLKSNKYAFTYVQYRINEFSGILEILKRGKQNAEGEVTLPPSPISIRDKEIADLERIWNVEKANGAIILSNKELVLSIPEMLSTLTEAMKKIEQSLLDVVILLQNRSGISGKEFADIATEIFNAQDIHQDLNSILDVNVDSSEARRNFTKKVATFDSKLKDLKQKYSSELIYSKLIDIENNFAVVKNRTDDILRVGDGLAKVNKAYTDIYGMITTFLEDTASLEAAYVNQKRWFNSTTADILAILTFISLIGLLFCMYKDNEYSLEITKDQNRKLQGEVQQLVTELKDLANGNLTVKATAISEGITGSIAEAVNYALNALRRLVKGINQTSLKVSSSAEEVKKITNELVRAMNSQAQEIVNTTSSVSTMASSIDQVSLTAKKSAKVAEDSVQIAHEGAEIVQNTIGGMERIREQIRETEKRIQRLGESSQEIGEIVSLIDGISEQTNILSLNAAIQAAMAGDAGMGFAVVADEVQQLAVKSSQAAKEVENIVKAIRGDTARAFESMGHAISEVTTGTKLAHDAGHALGKIENVSKTLSELIQGISTAAEEQAKVSGKIFKMMEIIESIARETASGTAVTAESIDKLTSLVTALQVSVKEFKLPEEAYG